ncbi:hypothetical protein HK405_006951 [Cladochytrium tenue]|nr:hypothetical protein HK405_006951 [Cladochytrium tenue]
MTSSGTPPGTKVFTPEDLAAFDGRDSAKPVYLAIKGTVFDVTKNRGMYAPGQGYSVFAGKDASKALGMSSLKPEDCISDYSTLNEEELQTLNKWEAFYKKKYDIVGRPAMADSATITATTTATGDDASFATIAESHTPARCDIGTSSSVAVATDSSNSPAGVKPATAAATTPAATKATTTTTTSITINSVMAQQQQPPQKQPSPASFLSPPLSPPPPDPPHKPAASAKNLSLPALVAAGLASDVSIEDEGMTAATRVAVAITSTWIHLSALSLSSGRSTPSSQPASSPPSVSSSSVSPDSDPTTAAAAGFHIIRPAPPPLPPSASFTPEADSSDPVVVVPHPGDGDDDVNDDDALCFAPSSPSLCLSPVSSAAVLLASSPSPSSAGATGALGRRQQQQQQLPPQPPSPPFSPASLSAFLPPAGDSDDEDDEDDDDDAGDDDAGDDDAGSGVLVGEPAPASPGFLRAAAAAEPPTTRSLSSSSPHHPPATAAAFSAATSFVDRWLRGI